MSHFMHMTYVLSIYLASGWHHACMALRLHDFYNYITVTGFMGFAFLPTQVYIAEGLYCMNVCR